MRKSTQYYSIDRYKHIKEALIRSGETFIMEETTYTRKIRFENKNLIFNEDGNGDNILLALINTVRRDAKKYIETNVIPADFQCDFFKLVDKPPKTVISKVDVSGAYWHAAINLGLISEKTDHYLKSKYKTTKEMKKARLKALGSLATRKKIYTFVNGCLIETEDKVEETKEAYMYICFIIDQLMSDTALQVPGAFYYYWDCIFTDKRTAKDVIDYILEKGYHTKTQETTIEVMNVFDSKYLLSNSDDKMYIVRKEEEFMLEEQGLVVSGLNYL